MDQKVSLYLYTEISLAGNFSELKRPAVLSELAEKYHESSKAAFINCGGLKITDHFNNEQTHVRKSFWSSAEGYHKWNGLMADYLQARKQYQRENHIAERLEGPFEAQLNE